ncbi:MAG: hypothetical protein A4E45_00066 [Methanosaeta sp. PtaB.Bin039]|nr:MAG: hypothetical protein A4E45_00066 [Methanosaeta sp. PtaB.Bin039]
MRIELDISLKNPLDSISIESIYDSIIKNRNYKISYYCKNNFILIELEEKDIKIRIHEDGRCYIIKEIEKLSLSNEIDLIMHMFQLLDRFLEDVGLKEQLNFKDELSLSFRGYLAYSLLWRNYSRIKEFGNFFLGLNVMRIYEYNNSISIKMS